MNDPKASTDDRFEPGDHLASTRLAGGYTHHGIYVGDGQVVHFDSSVRTKFKAVIREVALERFGPVDKILVVRHDGPVDREEILRRARSRVGEAGYCLVWNNCEHFANWCVSGSARSEQVRRTAGPVMRMTLRGVAGTVLRKSAVKAVTKSIASPWNWAADATQLATEKLGEANGLSPQRATLAGRGAGFVTAAGVGCVVGGPIGAGVATGVFSLGVVGEEIFARSTTPKRRPQTET
ncbi:lecithin retinol acyltransferase family protein [Stratiformator vulcanicus]|uniref:NC domain protein n=1 Tax=Stratiformator vulcanicus TaxID=2527980 RepID=A0A517R4U6_9PLAN|nr:lecithin retinol acyltransferase family protein [Stratiformator vulcanicus]QDT38905.1 NC domain protein [Stratiformator vulcanicus]